MTDQPDLETNTMAETDSFIVWEAQEPDGETTYHIELGQVTLHFFREEWAEFQELMRQAG